MKTLHSFLGCPVKMESMESRLNKKNMERCVYPLALARMSPD